MKPGPLASFVGSSRVYRSICSFEVSSSGASRGAQRKKDSPEASSARQRAGPAQVQEVPLRTEENLPACRRRATTGESARIGGEKVRSNPSQAGHTRGISGCERESEVKGGRQRVAAREADGSTSAHSAWLASAPPGSGYRLRKELRSRMRTAHALPRPRHLLALHLSALLFASSRHREHSCNMATLCAHCAKVSVSDTQCDALPVPAH